MRLARRLRATLRPRPPAPDGPADRWSAFLARVEPALAASPRVHTFAQPPRIGGDDVVPAPLAVWIEDGADDTSAALVRSALVRDGQEPTVLAGSLRSALGSTTASHVLLVGRGCVPAPLALRRLGQAIALVPQASLITTDEDRLDDGHRRHEPRFRPAPSPDRWLARDDTGRMMAVATEQAARLAGDLSPGPAWLHELALGLALDETGPLAAAHVPLLLSHVRDGALSDAQLSAEATARVLRRYAPGARVESDGASRRVRWAHPGEASVEVIICLRDRPELLSRCVDSLLTRTAYDRLAVTLVDNGSREQATLDLLARLQQRPGISVIRDDRPFNFAALNNAAAVRSDADVLVFLNNDTEVVDPGWVETLLEEARRPEVGAVAPLLVYPDGAVQHAGAALGLHGYAGHPFAGLSPDGDTPFGRPHEGTRNWLAVTAACMMVERSKFEAVGGFDESFVVAGNDVDLCLRLTAAGHRSLCVPHTVLVHDESRSRGVHIDPGDFVRSQESYGEFRTVGDPFYNPNLTLSRTDCSVRVHEESTG